MSTATELFRRIDVDFWGSRLAQSAAHKVAVEDRARLRRPVAACYLYSRLALAAVLNDRLGDRSSLWELPGTADLHMQILRWLALRVEPRAIRDDMMVDHVAGPTLAFLATTQRYTRQGWAWHSAWLKQERVRKLHTSRFGKACAYVPGAGTLNVKAAAAARDAKSLPACISRLVDANSAMDSKTALATVVVLLENIVERPTGNKFRRLRLTNKRLMEAIFGVEGGIELLFALGFERVGPEHLMLAQSGPSAPSVHYLSMAVEHLRTALGQANVHGA
eukprot:SAG31_NODE_1161_length_9593_cov_3.825629_4_plen_277_part_00